MWNSAFKGTGTVILGEGQVYQAAWLRSDHSIHWQMTTPGSDDAGVKIKEWRNNEVNMLSVPAAQSAQWTCDAAGSGGHVGCDYRATCNSTEHSGTWPLLGWPI